MLDRDFVNGVVSLAAVVGAAVSLTAPILLRNLPPDRNRLWKSVIVAGWILLPPFWFWVEFAFLFRSSQPEELVYFKYGQDLSRHIWLAFLLVISMLYFRMNLFNGTRIQGDPYYSKADPGPAYRR